MAGTRKAKTIREVGLIKSINYHNIVMVKNNSNIDEFRKMADLLSDMSKDYKHRGYLDIAEYLMAIVIELHEAARLRENGNNVTSLRRTKHD